MFNPIVLAAVLGRIGVNGAATQISSTVCECQGEPGSYVYAVTLDRYNDYETNLTIVDYCPSPTKSGYCSIVRKFWRPQLPPDPFIMPLLTIETEQHIPQAVRG